jgi:hypothetical protein
MKVSRGETDIGSRKLFSSSEDHSRATVSGLIVKIDRLRYYSQKGRTKSTRTFLPVPSASEITKPGLTNLACYKPAPRSSQQR